MRLGSIQRTGQDWPDPPGPQARLSPARPSQAWGWGGGWGEGREGWQGARGREREERRADGLMEGVGREGGGREGGSLASGKCHMVGGEGWGH